MSNKENNKIKNICIFASSSDNIDKVHFKAAYEMGAKIGDNGFNIIYGGSVLGLMGEATSAARAHGAEITGVMPEKLYNLGIFEGECTKFILTKGMRERKAKMDELSDAIIALSGGFGTLEELSEMIVQKQLGYNNKPIVILNTNGFYDNLIKFFNDIISQRFAPDITSKLYYVTKSSDEAIDYIKTYDFEEINYLNKKLSIK